MTTDIRFDDHTEILNQLGRAARLLDQKRWGDLDQVFADSTTFDYGDGLGVRTGRNALSEQFRRFLDRCGATQHLLGSVILTRTPHGARTEAYVQARHLGVGELAGEVFDTNGEYTDDWVETPHGWRITHRSVAWLTLSGNPAVLGI